MMSFSFSEFFKKACKNCKVARLYSYSVCRLQDLPESQYLTLPGLFLFFQSYIYMTVKKNFVLLPDMKNLSITI